MGSIAKEVALELQPFLRAFKDGTVERFMGAPIVPANPHGVSSKDITISKNPPTSARIYLPKLEKPDQKLPILVYFHGGAFCIESAYSLTETAYMNSLVSRAKIIAVSIEYRLAPENLLPIAYEDCWLGLQWVASHNLTKSVTEKTESEPENEEEWIINHGDFSRFFIGGDSAGANIAHNIAMRIAAEGMKNEVKLLGFFVTHPYFWGSEAIGSESPLDRENQLSWRIWTSLHPSAAGGIDSPMMNPAAEGAPPLAALPGRRILVSVAEKDELRERGVLYYEKVKESGWKGEIELIEVEGEEHAFHIVKPGTENSYRLIQKVADFLVK